MLLWAITVSTTWPERRTNSTWPLFWLASSNRPLKSALDFAEWLLPKPPNLYLDCRHLCGTRGLRRVEVKLQRFLQVSRGVLFGLALAGDIDFEARRDIPLSFRQTVAGNGRFLTIFFHMVAEFARLLFRLDPRGNPRIEFPRKNKLRKNYTKRWEHRGIKTAGKLLDSADALLQNTNTLATFRPRRPEEYRSPRTRAHRPPLRRLTGVS